MSVAKRSLLSLLLSHQLKAVFGKGQPPGWVSLGPGLGTPASTAIVLSPRSLLGLPLLAELIGVSSVASGF